MYWKEKINFDYSFKTTRKFLCFAQEFSYAARESHEKSLYKKDRIDYPNSYSLHLIIYTKSMGRANKLVFIYCHQRESLIQQNGFFLFSR